jgi:hypothetical protein
VPSAILAGGLLATLSMGTQGERSILMPATRPVVLFVVVLLTGELAASLSEALTR